MLGLIEPSTDQTLLPRRVNSFSLPNGFKFVVLERGVSPTVSFVTYVDVGASDEVAGKTGIAHFLEHLAFKGTESIGTKDYGREIALLNEIDDLNEQKKSITDQQKRKLSAIDEKIMSATAQAEELVISNDFSRIVQQEGGVGLNAATTIDSTQYFYNFPSNKTELWFALESERFQKPVFRQFEKEKAVVLEERKLRVDNDSVGQFLEQYLMKAFDEHPYRRPVIGFEQDIRGLSRADVMSFFRKYYRPENITFGIVGDTSVDEVRKLAEKYFGGFEAGEKSSRTIPEEPVQKQEKSLVMKLDSEPWYVEGYHVPAFGAPEYPALRLLEGVLSGGRTSRLFRSLVLDKQIALQASFSSGFPGDKYASLGLLFALPAPGKSLDSVRDALREQIETLKSEGVKPSELARIKRSLKVSYLNAFQSNETMAGFLCEFAAKTGDAKNAFRLLGALDEVKPEDVTNLARTVFVESNRTVGKIL
uniref:Alpha-MPP n=1 Tax=Rhodosorus marinus TaxID=101924 RepID=A0A7S3EK04_9RHOD|mmetsp:Transcript_42494/g.165883  ORF Transcript_42494/g.165883 Transcript_42494/m.165883 type:complete len:477 (+) Transcript_42494:297-1727(+)